MLLLTNEMISIFHLYVATLQQYLNMEYISLSWCDIPELVFPIMISGDLPVSVTPWTLSDMLQTCTNRKPLITWSRQ
jgi:hypothetical protein